MSLYDSDDLAGEDIAEDEEKLRRIYIALSAHRGGFIFDRTLGSDVYRFTAENNGQLEAAVREALSEIPEAECSRIIKIQGSLYAVIRLGNETYNVPIKGGEE